MPKFILSKSKVYEQLEKCSEFADLVSYSSKTNPEVTHILQDRACFFSVHFENELKHIKDPSKAWFLAQGLSVERIRFLFNKGIRRFVIENTTDLDLLINELEQTNINIKLLLRAKLKEFTIRTEKHYVFGIAVDTVNKKIEELYNHKNILEIGIHFHRKTQNMAEWNLLHEIQHMFPETTLKKIELLCVGGGLPSEYANTNVKVIDSIVKRIQEVKKYLNSKKVLLMVEPGRFIAAPAGELHTTILSIIDNTIIVDASVYNSDMDALIVPVKLLVKGETTKEEGKPYVVKGITPCSMDLFRYRVYLKEPRVGDSLVFVNAGAYNFYTDFCDLEKIKTVIK